MFIEGFLVQLLLAQISFNLKDLWKWLRQPHTSNITSHPVPVTPLADPGSRRVNGLYEVGWKNATVPDRRTLLRHSIITVHSSECGCTADPKLAMAEFPT
jgi:hypothetical protein